MTIQEIYNTKEIQQIENKIVGIFSLYGPIDSPYGICTLSAQGKKIVDINLRKRMYLLNEMFTMNDEYKSLLYDFNEALKAELIKMRQKAIKAFKAVSRIDKESEINVQAKCFMGCKYPELHPIKTTLEKRMWAILSGSLGCQDEWYKNGVMGTTYDYYSGKVDSNKHLLYNSRDKKNWNEGLDGAMTKDMYLVHAFHNLYHRCKFSIFDLLWVREFTTEIIVTIDNHAMDVTKTIDRFEPIKQLQ